MLGLISIFFKKHCLISGTTTIKIRLMQFHFIFSVIFLLSLMCTNFRKSNDNKVVSNLNLCWVVSNFRYCVGLNSADSINTFQY